MRSMPARNCGWPAAGRGRPGSVPAATIARALLNDLAVAEQDFILVLDDYQVIHNQAIHDLITDILLHPPRTLRLFIAARQDPPLPLAALRARGDVTELRKADLWFTPEEARRFLVESMQLTLDERAIAVLTDNIGGWPVGLRLAALYLRQQRGGHACGGYPG